MASDPRIRLVVPRIASGTTTDITNTEDRSMAPCRSAAMVLYLDAAFIVLLILAEQGHAYNGAVAVAVPVDGIAIDGDLSDWPTGLWSYPIALTEYGVSPRDASDYEGWFRIGYSVRDKAMYVAIEVIDESNVLPPAPSLQDWSGADGCEVYLLDPTLEEKGEMPRQYAIRGRETGLGLSDGYGEATYRGAFRRTAQRHTYEWRLPLAEAASGMRVGFDIAILDRDADSSFSWMAWGPGAGKAETQSSRVGVVLLVEEGTVSRAAGVVRWEDPFEGQRYGAVRAETDSLPDLVFQAATDGSGRYAVVLPSGRYRFSAGYRRQSVEIGTIEVRAGMAVELPATAFPVPPRGLRRPRPEGVKRTAGSGQESRPTPPRRQGDWDVLDVTCGLPSPSVPVLHQDRKGTWWLGDAQDFGLLQYDGHRLTRLTAEDGLPSNSVTSIAEDNKGQLWLGTTAGLCQYDGNSFVTYDQDTGLPANQVNTVVAGQDSTIWAGTDSGLVRLGATEVLVLTREDGLPASAVIALAFDPQGRLWAVTPLGVAAVDPITGNAATLQPLDKVLAETVGNVTCVFRDSRDKMWVGTRYGTILSFEGDSLQICVHHKGLPAGAITSITEDRDGRIWAGIAGFGLAQYEAGAWTLLTKDDGLPDTRVFAPVVDAEGSVWFGTWLAGVVRFDGVHHHSFKTNNIASAHGMSDNVVYSTLVDRDGKVWFGNEMDGLRVLEGDRLQTVPGPWPPHATIGPIMQDRHGCLWFALYDLWFGGNGAGIVRLAGGAYKSFTATSGLPSDKVTCLFEDRAGRVWIGTRDGASWFDGTSWHTVGREAGLLGDIVTAVAQMPDGRLVLATTEDISFLDAATLKPLEHLAIDGSVLSVMAEPSGRLWVGTWSRGVAWYDQGELTWLGHSDGRPSGGIRFMRLDPRGHVWIGTFGGGISRFDGTVFQPLTTEDGLSSNGISGVDFDSLGNAWIATLDGVTYYRPRRTVPAVHLTDVVSDRRYGPVGAISLSSSGGLVAFEYQGQSYRTRPGRMAYVYELDGFKAERQWTRGSRVEYRDLPRGSYVFRVWAVDRDLNYSEPAEVRLRVHLTYGQLSLRAGLALALAGLVVASHYGVRRRHERDRAQSERDEARERLLREMAAELQTAHDLQMGLMPKESPQVLGLQIAGRCLTANHVGGDFYQYFNLPGDRLVICITDVTGHAMDAAIPAVMFDGILDSQMRVGGDLQALFTRLNGVLCEKLTGRTHVAFAMAEIDLAARSARLANAGCPYPCHYRQATGDAIEVAIEAYPFGARADTTYCQADVQLESGDYLVFYSDGLAEAADAAGDLFTFERTVEAIRAACAQGLSAAAVIDYLLAEVRTFIGDVPQADDMTCVVVKVEERPMDQTATAATAPAPAAEGPGQGRASHLP